MIFLFKFKKEFNIILKFNLMKNNMTFTSKLSSSSKRGHRK